MAERRFQSVDTTPDHPRTIPTERRLAPIRAAGKPAPLHRPGLPVPVRKAATAVAVGAALQIGASLAMHYLAGSASRRGAALAAGKGLRAATRTRGAGPARSAREDDRQLDIDDASLVSEMLVVRRVWLRRGQD